MSKNHSDFWRKPYQQEEEVDLTPKQIKEDLCKIINSIDNSFHLSYKEKGEKNDIDKNTIILNKNIALNTDLSIGQKIDIYSGDALLGAVLRAQGEEAKVFQANQIRCYLDPDTSNLDRATSLLYFAIEADAACSVLSEKTPGFVNYALAKAKYSVGISSQELQQAFQAGPNDAHKFMALLREFNTFNSQPLNYGGFNAFVKAVIQQVRNLPDYRMRFAAARQLAQKFLVNFDPDSLDMGSMGELGNSGEMFGLDKIPVPNSADPNEENHLDEGSKSLDNNSFDDIKTVLSTKNLNSKSIANINQATGLYQKASEIVRPLSEAIRESLQILNQPQKTWDEYSLRRGELDEGALCKLNNNSDDIFYQNETMPKTRIQIGFLIDESASMETLSEGVPRFLTARRLAVAFADGTREISGLDLQIYGHAAPKVCHVNKYYDSANSESQIENLGYITARLYNYDGFAIQRTAQDMLESDREYNRRILFILSDGEPSASRYSGEPAYQHIEESINKVNNLGVETYVIGVDKAFSKNQAAKMYGEGKFIILPNCDINDMSMIISAFLEEIAKN